MTTAAKQTEAVEQRLAVLEKEIAGLRAQVLGSKPRENDWRRTAGTFPSDEMTLEAERLGREWCKQANNE